MRANLKGQGGVKNVLLLHGEKAGMAVVGLCAVMFVYFSLRQERLRGDYGPENLSRQIRETTDAIGRYKWEDAPEKGVAQPLRDIADIAVRADDYPISAIDPPVMPPTVLRTDPVLLPAEDVGGRGGSGLLAFIDEAVRKRRELDRQREAAREAQARDKEQAKQQQQDETGRRRKGGEETAAGPAGAKQPKGRAAGGSFRPEGVALNGDERVELAYWACVVAKVPVKDQLARYRDVFENARGSQQADEFPEYRGFLVRRAEVRSGQPLEWEPVAVYDGQGKRIAPVMANIASQIMRDWAPGTLEVVDPLHTDPLQVLLYPLPPLVGRDWGSEATHPDIPLASEVVDQRGQDEAAGEPAAGKDAGEGTDTTDLFGKTASPPEGRSRYPGVGMPRDIGRFEQPGDPSESYARPPVEVPYTGAERGVDLGRGASQAALPRDGYWLLRFFDFSVQPGKKYQYQVRLVLADPNQRSYILRDWLDSSVLKRIQEEGKKYRLSDWSEPSATIGIPDAGSVRVVEARTPSDKVFNDEPRVKLLVESFDVDDKTGKAMQAQLEKEFRRGYVANMTDDAEILVDQNRNIEPVDSFEFRTGITVLDIRGGDRLGRVMLQPASALLMSSAGQLSVRNQLDDADDIERFHAIFDKDSTRRGRKAPAQERYEIPPGVRDAPPE